MRLPTKTPGAATAAAGVATLPNDAGVITTESLSTAAGATYTLTLGCNDVEPSSVVLAEVALAGATTGTPVIAGKTVGVGVITFVVLNAHASAAFNGTLRIDYFVIK